MGDTRLSRICFRSISFFCMVAAFVFMFTIDYQFHAKTLPSRQAEGITSSSLEQIVYAISTWVFSFRKWKRNRFQHLPPFREAIHSWFVRMLWLLDSTYDEPVISVKDFPVFHDAQYPSSLLLKGIEYKVERDLWHIDRRIWDPGIANLRRIKELMQEKILSININIRLLWSFFCEKIVKNEDLITLGLILERERNRFINLLASKASVSKASWKFASLSFFLLIGYIFVDVYFDLLSVGVSLMYQLLYKILNQ